MRMLPELAGTLLISLMLMSVGASSTAAAAHPVPEVEITWAVVDNFHDDGFKFLLTLENVDAYLLPAEGWTLHFNFTRRIHTNQAPPTVRVTHVNGDFYRLEPTEAFEPLMPGERRVLQFTARAWAIKEIDAARGFFFTAGPGVPPRPVTRVFTAPFVHDAQTNRQPRDRMPVPTPASSYAENAALSLLPGDQVDLILPTPRHLQRREGSWTLSPSTIIRYDAATREEARFLAAALEELTGHRPTLEQGGVREARAIVLKLDSGTGGAEAYRLSVHPGTGAEIAGNDRAGVFYGIQSLLALLPPDVGGLPVAVPAVEVNDAPRFGYRGMHLDVSRNFQPPEAVRLLLDQMAFYKLNRLHFHLTDDEGWRLAIAGLPELTDIGGRRGHTWDERDHLIPSFGSGPFPTTERGSGHFSREEYIDLLRFATERHIEVIPEIDVPGHARAAIVAMEARYHRLNAEGREAEASAFRLHDPEDTSQYRSVQGWDDNVINVCIESTYRFMDHVIDDLVAMHAEAGAPLNMVHVGGDEVPAGVWEESPACRAVIASDPGIRGPRDLFDVFLRRVDDSLRERGLTLAGWEEVALTNPFYSAGGKEPNPEFVERGFVPFVWNAVWGWGAEDLGYKLANVGYPVVLSNASALYFDLAYDKHPEEAGLYWAGFVSTRTAWEFEPNDLFVSARTDLLGNPLDEAAFADRARPTAEGRANILGIQGQLWSETLIESSRMEYMIFPRLLALAERAWAPEPEWAGIANRTARFARMDTEWNAFANRVGQREMPRMDRVRGGIGYRLPVPGAVIEDGILRANVSYPGVTLRYTTDGSTPTPDSPAYRGPVRVEGPISIRAFDTRGRGGRTVRVDN
jgi:hexosaminidase